MTGFRYRGYDIYIKPQDNQLLFYTINEENILSQFYVFYKMEWIGRILLNGGLVNIRD